MKNWFDLTKTEQIAYKNDFNSKCNKVRDFRIHLYLLAGFNFFIFCCLLASKLQNSCNNDICKNNLIIFGMLFFIFFMLALINSIKISNHEKNFVKWLKARNIEK